MCPPLVGDLLTKGYKILIFNSPQNVFKLHPADYCVCLTRYSGLSQDQGTDGAAY